MIQAGHRVVAAPYCLAALSRAPEAQVIVVDRVEGSDDASRAVLRIKSMPEIGEIPQLCIAQTDSVDERVRLLEAAYAEAQSTLGDRPSARLPTGATPAVAPNYAIGGAHPPGSPRPEELLPRFVLGERSSALCNELALIGHFEDRLSGDWWRAALPIRAPVTQTGFSQLRCSRSLACGHEHTTADPRQHRLVE